MLDFSWIVSGLFAGCNWYKFVLLSNKGTPVTVLNPVLPKPKVKTSFSLAKNVKLPAIPFNLLALFISTLPLKIPLICHDNLINGIYNVKGYAPEILGTFVLNEVNKKPLVGPV